MMARLGIAFFGFVLFIGAAGDLAGKSGVICAAGLCIVVTSLAQRIIDVVGERKDG